MAGIGRLRALPHAPNIDAHDAVPLFSREVHHRGGRKRTEERCIVDDDVERPPSSASIPRQRNGREPASSVISTVPAIALPSCFGDGSSRGTAIQHIQDRHGRALSGEPSGQARADPLRGARDDRDLPFEHHACFSCIGIAATLRVTVALASL
jgi:hypothetical protein